MTYALGVPIEAPFVQGGSQNLTTAFRMCIRGRFCLVFTTTENAP